ncbi:Activator of Hsp90 ATPase homolog 1-like protein [Chishuiella changwenlii]|uniref:Activator of Hsp90 ATPase homolog 1-like protein n=1 Tax=Chishuiella changwenlii TaxID=1434701 RepID=A0A1M6X7A0_9FLAO|nr:SRPBCC domain-containing protein [Chishuiella changwenlii]GGE97946.1 hypothetical protein GCM10010984_14380 [Chishuiella changwenlii]SHL01798.1 Activator of Hsp90 ATPase homolog 1-like protein [Chishuiella changwenlii]
MNDTVLLNMSLEANAEEIWNVLTNVDTFNNCFDNTSIEVDEFKSGNVVKFVTDVNGEKVIDEAAIRSCYTNERLSYGYKKQNTTNEIDVSFTLKPSGNFTYLTIEGRNFSDDFDRSHSENNWINMMQGIKKYIQNK